MATLVRFGAHQAESGCETALQQAFRPWGAKSGNPLDSMSAESGREGGGEEPEFGTGAVCEE
jgi:hypothetical protein